jgi:uncharacterized protein (TIGR03437 family)
MLLKHARRAAKPAHRGAAHPVKRYDESSPSLPGTIRGANSVKPARFAASAQSADNPADPYIMAQAAALGNDTNQIFAFVRDQIAYQAYRGSLRGARGTLWSRAGNSLDRASLLVALLGAAGVPARYVEGTIPVPLQQQLILSMFPKVYQVTGCQPLSLPKSDPANDPALLSIAANHFWVEFGAANTPADPSSPTAQPGSAPGAAVRRFTVIPAELQHTVTFRVDVEMFQQLSAVFGFGGNGITNTQVLNQTFASTDLVGVPVTLGHFVNVGAVGALAFSATTFTYSPYLRLGTNPAQPINDQILRGQDYQEIYTNLPLSSQALVAVFLRMDVNSPGAPQQTYERALVDRIGFAARQGGTAVTISTPGSPQAALSDVNLITVNAASSGISAEHLNAYQNAAAALDAQRTAAIAARQAAPSGTSQQAIQAMRGMVVTMRELITTLGAATTSKFVSAADEATRADAFGFDVASYVSSPRLIAFISGPGGDLQNGPVTYSFALDLRKNDATAIAAPGQGTLATFAFQSHRGIRHNQVEAALMARLTQSLPGQPMVKPFYIMQLFEAAQNQGIPSKLLDQTNLAAVSSLPIGAEAQARITAAVSAGRVVVTPTAPVLLNGTPQVGWIEIDPATGQLQDTLPDGGHQGITSYVAVSAATGVLIFALMNPDSGIAQFLLGFLIGFFAGLVLTALLLLAVFTLPGGLALSNAQLFLASVFALPGFSNLLLSLSNASQAFKAGFLIGVVAGVLTAFLVPLKAGPGEPEITASRGGLLRAAVDQFPQAVGNPFNFEFPIATAVNGPIGLAAPSLSLSQMGELLANNAVVPLAFTALFPNASQSDQTFMIGGTAPAGFTLTQSLPSITVPAGKTGQLDVCLVPSGQLPPAGQQAALSVTATNGGGPQAVNANFTVPAIQALALSATPAALSATPGQAVNATLTIQSVGNVAFTGTLSSTASSGLNVAGLNPNINLGAGQTSTQNLTFTPSAATPVGTELTLTLSGSDSTTLIVPVTVSSAQAQTAAAGSASAAALGRTDISTTLARLSGAINGVVASCSAATQAGVLAYLDNLIQQMNAPYLANFVAELQAARAAIASSACANIGVALGTLNTALSRLNTVLSSPAAFPFDFMLLPNSRIAQPGQPTGFSVFLRNTSTTAATYSISLGALPGGAAGNLSQNSVTLNPGEASNNPGPGPIITITPSNGTAFSFDVTASVNGVTGSARTIQGQLTARSEFLNVVDVVATPGFTNAGGTVNVVARLANAVNQAKDVKVLLAVKNSSNATVLNGPTRNVTLNTQSFVVPVDFGGINTAGLANGFYSLAVTVTDTADQPIPGGSGSGTLLIGSPVMATLSVIPQNLPPGNSVVTSTLRVTETNPQGGGGFNLLGSTAITGGATSILTYGNYAYTCGLTAIAVADITNPASPQTLHEFAQQDISSVASFANHCVIKGSRLIMITNSGGNGNSNFWVYDLSTPAAPTKLAGPIYVGLPFVGALGFHGDNLWMTTSWFRYFLANNDIFEQNGRFIGWNFTDPVNPAFLAVMSVPEQPSFDLVFPEQNTVIYGSTTATGTDPQGTGKIVIADLSVPTFPRNPPLTPPGALGEVQIPGTAWAQSLEITGNKLVVLGNTRGWEDFSNPFNFFNRGKLTVSVFDISTPRIPVLLGTTITNITTYEANMKLISGNQFVLDVRPPGETPDQPGQLYLMDVTNPSAVVMTPGPQIPGVANVAYSNGLVYAPTSAGLSIYQIGAGQPVTYTATLQLPKGARVAYNNGSFNPAPSTITQGPAADTATWTNINSATITFTSNVTGIQPGEVLPVVTSGTVVFTHPLGNGTISLPGTSVNSSQILSLNPETRTVQPGEAASYTVTVKNPAANAVTYNLAVTGVIPAWVTLPAAANVPANGQVDVTLQLRSALADAAGTYGFVVTATAGGTSGSVQGTLVLQGVGTIGNLVSAGALGLAVSVTPVAATGGQGTAKEFIVRVTNTGNVTDVYNLTSVLPAGVTGTFSQSSVTVPPGLGNFRELRLTLTAQQGTAPGAKDFTVTGTSQANNSVNGQASGTLNVVPNGVSVTLAPNQATPGSTINLTVTNRGSVGDTFDLALGGPGALISTLGTSVVTLAPGASQIVPVTIGQAAFATLGTLTLQAVATSRGNSSVSALASAIVNIGIRRGVAAAFSPQRQGLAAPGPATLLLEVENTGTAEGTYMARITGTTGPIQANLIGLDGLPSQTIPSFILPGVTQGLITVAAVFTGPQEASVTAEIVSLDDGSIKATATGFLGVGGVPVADAGKDRNVAAGRFTMLDGSGSYNPVGGILSFRWTLVSKPAGSAIAGVFGDTSPTPWFQPDVAGSYEFDLVVRSNGTDSAPDRARITAFVGNVPPSADAGLRTSARRTAPVALDGSRSRDYDRGPGPLTYLWTFQQVPAGSGLTNAAIVGANTPTPSFTPDVNGEFMLKLDVSDGAAIASDTAVVVAADPNVSPRARAGGDRRILPGSPINLDGRGSGDPDNGPQALTARWNFVSSSLTDADIVNATTLEPRFTPLVRGTHVARLTVSDGSAGDGDNAVVRASGYCDVNADGEANQIDFDLYAPLFGDAALPGDPLDRNADGQIDALDVAACQVSAPGNQPDKPRLEAEPRTLSFLVQRGAPLPPAQFVQIFGDFGLSVFARALTGGWISLSLDRDTAPARLRVLVSANGLAPGIYDDIVVLSSPQAGNTVEVRVRMTVIDPPRYLFVPSSLTFRHTIGMPPPASQNLQVYSTGRSVRLTATPTQPWLVIEPQSGTTPVILKIAVRPDGLEPGTHTAQVRITSDESTAGDGTAQIDLIVVQPPPAFFASEVRNAASLNSGSIAPGEVLVLSGTDFAAPGTDLSAPPPTQRQATILADTRVLFNGIPGSMLYLRRTQLSVIAPFALEGRLVEVQVVRGGVRSFSVAIPIAFAEPGVFTMAGSGRGQAAAFNGDGTRNGSDNPVPLGGIVTVYFTGAGATTPPGIDGELMREPFPVPQLPVTVEVDGKPAELTYIGGSAGLIHGLMQANIRISRDVTPGSVVPVVLKVGGIPSQPEVTIAVRAPTE